MDVMMSQGLGQRNNIIEHFPSKKEILMRHLRFPKLGPREIGKAVKGRVLMPILVTESFVSISTGVVTTFSLGPDESVIKVHFGCGKFDNVLNLLIIIILSKLLNIPSVKPAINKGCHTQIGVCKVIGATQKRLERAMELPEPTCQLRKSVTKPMFCSIPIHTKEERDEDLVDQSVLEIYL